MTQSRNEMRAHFDDHTRVVLVEQDIDGIAVTMDRQRKSVNANTAALLAVFIALVSALAVTALK